MLRIGRRKENCFPCYPIRLRRLFFRVFSPCQKQLLLMGFSSFSAPTNVRFPPLNRPIFFSPSRITERRFFYPIYVRYVPNILLPFWQKGALGLCGQGGEIFRAKSENGCVRKKRRRRRRHPGRGRLGSNLPQNGKGRDSPIKTMFENSSKIPFLTI